MTFRGDIAQSDGNYKKNEIKLTKLNSRKKSGPTPQTSYVSFLNDILDLGAGHS